MIKINSSSQNNSVIFYLTSSTTNDGKDWNFFLTDCKNTWKSSLTHIEIKTLAVSNGFQYNDYKNLLVSAFCESSNGGGFEFVVNEKESVQDELMLNWFQVLSGCKFLLADLKFTILMSSGISTFMETLHTSLNSIMKKAQKAKETNNTLESDCISLVSQSQMQVEKTKKWLEKNMMSKVCAILNEKKRKIRTLKSTNNTGNTSKACKSKTKEEIEPKCKIKRLTSSNETSSTSSVCKSKIKEEVEEPKCKVNKLDNDLTQLPDNFDFSVAKINKRKNKPNIIDNVSDSSDTTIGPDDLL